MFGFKSGTTAPTAPTYGALGADDKIMYLRSGVLYYIDNLGVEHTVYGVDPSRALIAGSGLTGGGTLASDVTFDANVDGSSLEISADAIRVKALGVTNAMLAGSIALTKLATQAASTILGNNTGGAAAPTALTTAQTKTLLAIVPGDVTGFDTQVRTSRLDQMAAPTASVSFGSQKITSLANGTVSTDAVNLGQLSAAVEGRSNKDPVDWSTTANITLSGLGTQAGGEWVAPLTAGQRVLAKDQSSSPAKGIYVVAAGAWTRAVDADTGAEITNASTLVRNGATLQGDTFTQTATVATIGTDAQTWVQTGEGATYVADGTSITLTGLTFSRNALTGDITAPAGSSVTTLASTIAAAGPVGSGVAVPVLTYDAKGRLTTVTTVATVGTVTATDASITIAGTATAPTVGLPNTISAAGPIGSTSVVPVITYDAKGRLTAVTTATITPAAIGAVPTTRQVIAGAALTGGGALSADITLDVGVDGTTIEVSADALQVKAGGIGTTQLANAGPGATGPIGSATAVPIVTIDAKGRVTALTSAALGTSAAKNVGNTVLDPGTGKLEYAYPSLGLVTGTNRTYLASERGYIVRRSNAGAAMSDTLPLLTNTVADIGYTITVYNEDTVLAGLLTMNASGGALFRSSVGGTAATSPLNYGTRQQFVWDGTAWILTAGNANIVRRQGAIVASNVPKFLDTAGVMVVDSGFPAAAATTTTPGFQSAADKARQDNQALGRVNILDFGGDRTGVTSSAAALTAAQAALPSGGIIEFPPGTYQFGNVNYNLSTAHITLQGTARYGTVFTTTNTAAPIITRNQYYQTIQDVTFTGTGAAQNPTGTAGQTLLACNAANSAYGVIRRVSFTYGYIMCDISDTLSIVDDIECRFFKNSGVLVNQNSDHKIEDATMDNNTSFLPTGGGIDVKLTASLLINSNNIIHSNYALWLNAAGGVTIPSVKGVNNFFDNSVVGLMIDGAGSVLRSEFTNSWFSSMSTAGVSLTPAGGGQADGITFVNCDIYNNVVGTTVGIQTNAQTKKWKAIGCSIAGWTTGVNLVAGASHYATLTANTIGAVSAFGVNTTGIAIASGAYLGIFLANNDCLNNTTAITIAATPTFSDYKQFRIIGNPGVNVGGLQTPPAATPVLTTVYTNMFGYPIMLNVKHGATANSAVTINGVANTMGFVVAQVVSYRLEPGDTWAVAGGTAPTVWVWNRQ